MTCNLGPDNVRHLLFECPIASEVWKLLGIEEVIHRACLVDRAGEAILEYLLCLSDSDFQVLGMPKLRETIAIISWYLWFEWRKRKHGEKAQNAAQIALAVRDLAENFVISCIPKARVKKNCWKKPRKEYMKLNIDASFDDDVLQGTVGAILRDHKGQFIAAANEKIDFCMDSFMAEATAVRFGMNLARSVGCGKLEIESDNTDVIEALKEGSSSSPASAIFDDCYFMSLDFTHVLFQHCFRESNCVAHELAKLARFSSPCTWLESPPDHILKHIVLDATLVEKE